MAHMVSKMEAGLRGREEEEKRSRKSRTRMGGESDLPSPATGPWDSGLVH